MRDLELLDDHFTTRDAVIVFVCSKTRVVDEKSQATAHKLDCMCLEDMYEALCRTAVMKALPTDTEVEEAGRVDGGDFLLQLRLFAPGDYDEWSERWYD